MQILRLLHLSLVLMFIILFLNDAQHHYSFQKGFEIATFILSVAATILTCFFWGWKTCFQDDRSCFAADVLGNVSLSVLWFTTGGFITGQGTSTHAEKATQDICIAISGLL